MKKLISILIAASFLLSCKKETYSGRIRAEEVAITQNQAITNPTTQLKVVKDTTISGKRIITYDKGLVIESVPKSTPNQYTVTFKLSGKAMSLVYEEIKTLTNVTGTFKSATGLVYSSMKIDTKGRILALSATNPLPVDQLGKQKTSYSSCVGNAINECGHSKICFVMCTSGGWLGCIGGWWGMCLFS